MSEREYVETLLERAEKYIAFIASDMSEGFVNAEAVRLWENTKEKLSAHTMRDLCKTWLDGV